MVEPSSAATVNAQVEESPLSAQFTGLPPTTLAPAGKLGVSVTEPASRGTSFTVQLVPEPLTVPALALRPLIWLSEDFGAGSGAFT